MNSVAVAVLDGQVVVTMLVGGHVGVDDVLAAAIVVTDDALNATG